MAYLNYYGADNDTLKCLFKYASNIFVKWDPLSAMKYEKHS